MSNVIERNNAKVIGQGDRTIMFAHGFGCDQSMWEYIAPSFANNYTIVLFDYVGSGNSDLSVYTAEKYSQFSGYVQDIWDVIETLKLNNLSKSTVPTLIMQCSDDSIVPIEVGEYLHSYLKNSTFRLMEAKGHYPHISHPEETISFINENLEQNCPDYIALKGY